VNRQYGYGNSKYVGIFDPLPTGHVTRACAVKFLAFNDTIRYDTIRYIICTEKMTGKLPV